MCWSCTVSVYAAPSARRGYEQPPSPGRHGSLRRQGQRRHRPVQQAQQQRRRPQHVPGICNHGVSIVCEGWLLPLLYVDRRPLKTGFWGGFITRVALVGISGWETSRYTKIIHKLPGYAKMGARWGDLCIARYPWVRRALEIAGNAISKEFTRNVMFPMLQETLLSKKHGVWFFGGVFFYPGDFHRGGFFCFRERVLYVRKKEVLGL